MTIYEPSMGFLLMYQLLSTLYVSPSLNDVLSLGMEKET